MSGTTMIQGNDMTLETAVLKGVVTVAIKVVNNFYSYKVSTESFLSFFFSVKSGSPFLLVGLFFLYNNKFKPEFWL